MTNARLFRATYLGVLEDLQMRRYLPPQPEVAAAFQMLVLRDRRHLLTGREMTKDCPVECIARKNHESQ